MGDKFSFVDVKRFKEAALAHRDQGLAVRKQFILTEVKEVLGEDRTLQFTVSTAAVDRDEDTVNPEGWKLDNYQKNPVVQWAHDYSQPPVARSLATWVENSALKSRAQFTPPDLYPFGYMIYRMYKEGYLNATSVGFMPIKFMFNEERTFGIDFLEQELLEYSAVPVPSNPEALIEARSKGIDVAPLLSWATELLDTWQEGGQGIWLPRKQVEQVIAILDPTKTFVMPATTAAQKAAISYDQAHRNGCPMAPEDEPWDGPGEVAAADQKELHIMCAWYDKTANDDDGDGWPDVKSAYKLPHHKARGEHAVVWRGVAAAMQRLLQEGTDIPDGDRRGVYDHLAKHYGEFDKEPPEFRAYTAEELKALFPVDEPEATSEPVTEVATASPTPVAQKSGRVLSRANEDRLRQAIQLLQEVVDQLEAQPEEDNSAVPETKEQPTSDQGEYVLELAEDEVEDKGESKADIDADALKELVQSAIGEALKRLTGRVD